MTTIPIKEYRRLVALTQRYLEANFLLELHTLRFRSHRGSYTGPLYASTLQGLLEANKKVLRLRCTLELFGQHLDHGDVPLPSSDQLRALNVLCNKFPDDAQVVLELC